MDFMEDKEDEKYLNKSEFISSVKVSNLTGIKISSGLTKKIL